ncbi:uncharacterized protein LOC126750488 isoform X2 [Anthonomus grandis grandis]|uniref:uncharacterized protein LOC126750488 isoform X2 n=1 Tax=Anthonomus grandis grandis TaxID=2921223 RepID=UPI00216694F6|nr:uncharacterized protein LOC126750488 isoform X2 [Anthonomus grandis grandis]
MNAKKPPKQRRRAVPKVNSKGEKGSLHHINRNVGKSKTIGAKRVTLLPGFLINGFTSGTVKRARGRPPTQKVQTREHLLTENLEAFLEQKSQNLRRSQRIIEKQGDENSHFFKSSGSNSLFEDQDIDMRVVSPVPTSCIKSILKKKPKSIFKQISEKFSKVQNERIREEEEENCYKDPVEEAQEASNLSTRFDENFASLHHDSLQYNDKLCENIIKKMRVTFRKNISDECQQNIKKQIKRTNAALEGKSITKTETNSDDTHSEEEQYETCSPLPPAKWVYYTPGKQKAKILPSMTQNPLQPAVMCQRDLFEFRPGCAVNYASPQNIPVENNGFLRRVTSMKDTPAPYRVPPVDQVMGYNGYYDQYVYPGQVQNKTVVMPPPNNLNPMYVDYHLIQNRVMMPPPPPPPLNDFCEQLNDLTFVDTGDNNYQPQAVYQSNRQSGEEVQDYRKWNAKPEETGNMFDFSKNPDNNLFNFGVM